MASITRTNGVGHAHATLYSTAQLKAFLITINDGSSAVDMSGEGGIGGALEVIAQETGALMFDSEGTGGVISVVCDGHAVDADSLQARIRALSPIAGAASIDCDGTTVVEGGQITVAA